MPYMKSGLVKQVTLIGLAGFFLSLQVQAQDAPAGIVLRGATIIDGISDSPLSGYSILVEGHTIRDILPAGAALPGNAQVMDMTGKYIIPGLIDTHVHWLEWMGELFVNHGVTSIVALTELKPVMRADSHASHAYPRLFHSANRPPFSPDDSAAEIRTVMKEWLAREPDIAHFPTHNSELSRAYAVAAREAHRAGFMIFGHAENAPDAVDDGLDVVEHIWAYGQAVMTDGELRAFQQGEYLTWAHLMSDDWDRLDGMIEAAVAAGKYLNPTMVYEWGGLSRRAGQRELEDYRTFSNPDLVYFPENIAKSLLAKHRQIKNFSRRYGNLPFIRYLPENDLAVFKEGYRNVNEFIRRYVAHGGKIMAGTDSITGGIPGLGLHQEMQMLVEAGLTPMQAIRSASRWSAEILEGVDGKRGPAAVGSIEKGKHADLVVLGSNPLLDITNSQDIEMVMKDGRWVTLGLHPEYYTHTSPPRAIAGSTFAPVISAITPSFIIAGSPSTRIALEGSGFQMTTLIRVNGVSAKTYFIDPRHIEFDLPGSLVRSPGPDPYRSPGPYQEDGLIGYRGIEIHAFNPPPEGGTSNTINLMVRPH